MAALRRSLSLSFSGCGWLASFHLGVADVLLRARCISAVSPLAGASGGSLVAAGLACGLAPRDMQRQLMAVAAGFRDREEEGSMGDVWGRLEPRLRDTLDAMLPADAAERCSGRLSVALTRTRAPCGVWLVDQFRTRDELLQALVCSSFIPWYLAPGWTRLFRGQPVVDGGFMELYPVVPGALAVCPYPYYGALRGAPVDIGPIHAGVLHLIAESLVPAADERVEQQFAHGQAAATTWLEAHHPRLPLQPISCTAPRPLRPAVASAA